MLPFQFLPINLKAAGQAEYAALNRHTNRIRSERLPDDPPIPLEEAIRGYQNYPPFIELQAWCAWDPPHAEIVAQGMVGLMRMDANQHLAQVEISVLPEYRRRGLGRELLRLATAAAEADGRRLLLAETVDRSPGGEAFMRRLGAEKGLESHVNQLRLADLDRDLIDRWLARGRLQQDDFELGLWDGPYPEAQLEAVCELVRLNNHQPFGTLEIEEIVMTPERLRQEEQMHFARGTQRWTFYVVERLTGRFAGYTETLWNPNRPELVRQEMTAVFPEWRGRGLGRWLKAAMLAKVLEERPQARFVRTGNADSNAAMLKINRELGFQPYMATALWQLETGRARQYLDQ